ncbi:hypothetical protein [Paenibacillus sp. LHD-38]|uniref:hypothetical protein n=1 Tax=Paenibacillus sp. LHD-38 TaxID=3072143 RepID=UPI00280F5138|nr:hypothetical protein [Paenibacillus sp. LHD-38]MDQ8739443.1 hypothetical protein [Paenibacillus sp. LHD-38]
MGSKKDSKSSGNKSRGSKHSDCRSKGSHESGGNKSHGSSGNKCCHKSSGNKCCHKSSGSKEQSCGKNDHVHCILTKIGVGTANIRIHFDGTSRTGVFLGIVDGCVVINVKGVVSYVKISSITSVDVGFYEKKKKKSKCRKRNVGYLIRTA